MLDWITQKKVLIKRGLVGHSEGMEEENIEWEFFPKKGEGETTCGKLDQPVDSN